MDGEDAQSTGREALLNKTRQGFLPARTQEGDTWISAWDEAERG